MFFAPPTAAAVVAIFFHCSTSTAVTSFDFATNPSKSVDCSFLFPPLLLPLLLLILKV